MSQHDEEFLSLLEALKDGNDADKMEAAKALGNFVGELNDIEYDAAKSALDRALADANPMIVMTAMQALTKYNRVGTGGDMIDIYGDDQSDIAPEKAAACRVCGKPEALIPSGGCERDNCPYA